MTDGLFRDRSDTPYRPGSRRRRSVQKSAGKGRRNVWFAVALSALFFLLAGLFVIIGTQD